MNVISRFSICVNREFPHFCDFLVEISKCFCDIAKITGIGYEQDFTI